MGAQLEAEKLLAEERRRKLLEQCTVLKVRGVDVTKLTEDISQADWTRFGAIFGLVWHKFDSLVNTIKDGNRNGDDIKRVLTSIEKILTGIERNTHERA